MKKQSVAYVYSDSECPHCSQVVNYDRVYQKFFELASPSGFEYPCPHCEKLIEVSVEPVPAFTFNKAVEHVNAADGGEGSPNMEGYDFDDDTPLCTTCGENPAYANETCVDCIENGAL